MDLGSCGPIKKKLKLTCIKPNCSICSTKIFTTATDSPDNYAKYKIYSELLIQYLIPKDSPSEWNKIILDSCMFCQRCIRVLEELKELDEVLENTKNGIKSKLITIKVSILKNKTQIGDDSIIKTFRKMAVEEFRPVVKLTKLKLPILEAKLKKRSFVTARKRIRGCNPNISPLVPKRPICSIKTDPEETSGEFAKLQETSVFSLSDSSVKSEMVTFEAQMKGFDFLEDVVKFEPWNEVGQNFNSDPLTENNNSLNVNTSNDYSVDTSAIFQDSNPCTDDLLTRAAVSVPVGKIWSRPPLTMTQFAILAIKNCPKGGMVVHDIMNFISENFPYYRSAENWKFLVRNALSLNPCFVRNIEPNETFPTSSASMSGRWTLDERRITDAFKMKIVEQFSEYSERFFAYPERLKAMLQPLLVENISFSNSLNENIGPYSCFERPILYTDAVETSIPNMHYIRGTPNQNEVINPPGVNTSADYCQIQRVFGSEELYANIDQSLEPSHYVPTLIPEKEWQKPKLKYCFLAFVAIMNLPGQEATFRDICSFISENYPFFKKDRRYETSIYSAMNSSRYLLAKPAMYEAKLVKWTVDYDKIKFMLTIIADAVREDIASNCMAYPERLNEILRPLFANALTCDHIFFVTLKSSPVESMSADKINEYIQQNFYPFCYQNGLNSYNIFENLERSLFLTLNDQMKWSFVDAAKERMKKEIQYMITTSHETLLRTLSNHEMIALFIFACS